MLNSHSIASIFVRIWRFPKAETFGTVQVQDVWIHMFTLMVCLASMGAAVYQLVKTFDAHSYQSISVLVSFLTYCSLQHSQRLPFNEKASHV